jgi:hypothetical protein
MEGSENNSKLNSELFEPFIDLEAGLYSVFDNNLKPESEIITVLSNMKASDPKILTPQELKEIKQHIEKNMNYKEELNLVK